jgi:hypothetical protein
VPQVGHGQLGLRDDLRIFEQLQGESSCRTDAFVEIEGGALINDTWTPFAFAGPDYSYAWSQEFDGELLQVMSVRTLAFPTLTRLETQAQVNATAGTWAYYDGTLHVHLPDDSDPSGIDVLVTTAFNFGTAGAEREHLVQPYLGTELLADGDFDDNTLADWTVSTTGSGFSATRDFPSPPLLVNGGACVVLAGDGSGSGSVSLRQIPDSQDGGRYRYFGYYWTSPTLPSTARAYVQVDATSLSADGINQDASLTNGLALTNTHGRTRAFLFDHIAPASGSRVFLRLVNSAATACEARFDRVSYKPIHGWRLFHPRVAADGVPESEQGSLDVYPGSASTGAGSVRLMNDESAVFERMFSASPWTCLSRDVRIRYGGAFSDNGQEIVWNDMFLGQSGIVAGDQYEVVTDESATYSFEDARNIFEAQIPNTTYGDAYTTGEERDLSRPRARFFGAQSHIRPSRIDVDGTTGLGIYEVNDPTFAVGNALTQVDAVIAYADEDAAETNDPNKQYALVQGVDFNLDAVAGTIEIIQNPGVFLITTGEGPDGQGANDTIDFIANAVTYKATIPPAAYVASSLAGQVELEMEAASGGSLTVTYDNTTHLFNIKWNGGGNFELLTESGTNKERSALPIMGYTNSVDYTAATDYDGTTAVFTDPDAQNFLRCAATGYADDSDGTYTGAAGAPVILGPDIFRYVLHEMLHESTSRVDQNSFAEARSTSPQELGVYLGVIASVSDAEGGAVTVQQLVDRLEVSGSSTASGVADIVLGGDGVWLWRNRQFSYVEQVRLCSRDFLSWEGSRNGSDPYGFTRVNYGQDPSTGYVLGKVLQRDATILLDRRDQIRTFDSYLIDPADADDALEALGHLTRASIRHFKFSVKGALLGSNPGDKVYITRGRALQGSGETGGLDTDEFRILYLKKNYLTHVVEAVVHTNII